MKSDIEQMLTFWSIKH